MRSRVAEIDQDAVAHVVGDEAVEPGDDLGDGAMIGGEDLAQILGIEPRREPGRPYQIAEHHRELPSFGLAGPDASIWPWPHWLGRGDRRASAREVRSQRGDRG
jgi:hypothetical protein